jgi:hypothetical protein
MQAEVGDQPLDGAVRDGEAFAHHPPPDFPRAIDLEVLREDALDLGRQRQVPLLPRRELLGIDALGDVVAAGRRGDRQHLADRLDPMRLAVFANERDLCLNGRSSSASAK